jgi:hypothetical protein
MVQRVQELQYIIERFPNAISVSSERWSCCLALIHHVRDMAVSAVQAASSDEQTATSVNGKPKGGNPNGVGGVDIIDIRQVAVEVNLKEEILSMFHPKQGLRQLPTLLLYNERGLQIFEEV